MTNQQDRLDKTNAGGELGGTTFGQQPGEAAEDQPIRTDKDNPDPKGNKSGDRHPVSDAEGGTQG
jgi:hypothetical protein